MRTITLNKDKLISNFAAINNCHKYLFYKMAQYFFLEPGVEHYMLLNYLCSLDFIDEVTELGTHRGTSAVAMALHNKVKVNTYDVQNLVPEGISKLNNINYNILYIKNSEKHLEKMLLSDMIFLDTAHTGVFERFIYKYLTDNDYRGILLLDDIHLNTPMIEFWDSIGHDKYDITFFGHWSGTGLVLFNDYTEVKFEA